VIRRLDELRSSDADVFGGKSAHLGELLGAGFNVPPGFALTDPDDELPELRSLVAVRSSAVGEDGAEATFAGMQETFLGVRGEDVRARIRECWASAESERARAYRERMGMGSARMSVAVQEMVDADVSGVLFTCNPVTGDPSSVAVNASWGLGLAVVGGEVTPDEYVLSKVTGEVIRQTLGDKHVEYRPDAVAVPEERRRVACLDGEQLAELLDVAKRIEAHFGGHQDVEWAFAGRELFLLQARPVTVKREAPAPSGSALAMVMGKFGARPHGAD
jgi:phosphoenolpyruvate synthase/pyruvate phosphate dikinase